VEDDAKIDMPTDDDRVTKEGRAEGLAEAASGQSRPAETAAGR
jgi:hypothetical protein